MLLSVQVWEGCLTHAQEIATDGCVMWAVREVAKGPVDMRNKRRNPSTANGSVIAVYLLFNVKGSQQVGNCIECKDQEL